MRSSMALALALTFVGAWATQLSAASNPEFVSSAAGPTVSFNSIPADYYARVKLDATGLFTLPRNTTVRLEFPGLGIVAVVHDLTRAVDFSDRVLRWEGHLREAPNYHVVFVKGLTGNITGSIDTPAGRLLLGQMGGYLVYPESRSVSERSSKVFLDQTLEPLPKALVLREDDPARTRQEKPTAVAYPVEFDIAGLADVQLDDEVEVALPGLGSFAVVHDGIQAGDYGATTFVGYLKDYGKDFRMIVTYSATGAEGRILTPHGEFLLRTLGGRQWLIDVERSGLSAAPATMVDAIPPSELSPGELLVPNSGHNMNHMMAIDSTQRSGLNSLRALTTTGPAASAASTAATQIDVLLLYTAGLETALGSADQAKTRLQYLIAAANQAYADSDVSIQLRLVDMLKVAGPEDSNSTDALTALTNGQTPFQTAKVLRDQYGADLVALVRPFSTNQGGMCGVGWVGGYGGGSIGNYQAYGYSVVSDATVDQRNYCGDYTLTHEMGHNMGAMHDRATVASQRGGTGAYPYAFGYGFSGQFGTIMSYISPQIGKFSNPSKTCGSGVPCGVAETQTNSANNALALNNTRAGVANFRGTTTTVANYSITGVVAVRGAGVSNVQFRVTSPGSCTPSAGNGVFTCTVPSGWSGSITPATVGYGYSPSNRAYTKVSTNQAAQNFVAVPSKAPAPAPVAKAVSISGIVTAGGAKLGGVILQASNGAVCGSTDANGKFTCTVPKSWTGTITPRIQGYKFSPATRKLSKVTVNMLGQNFAGKR